MEAGSLSELTNAYVLQDLFLSADNTKKHTWLFS